MNLTPEQKEAGRRNFLKAVATTPALAAVAAATAFKGPVRGGPVRVGFLGVGAQGRQLLTRTDPAFAEVKAMCDINPNSLKAADEILQKSNRPPATHYVDWREMIQKENLEAVVTALPLWMHADVTVGLLEAGKHVLCEKMMAWDIAGCERMAAAAKKSGKVLEIGYQRYYNPVYVAAYNGIVKDGILGDVYCSRLAWHRNQNWRRKGEPPSPSYDPSQWGYPDWEHLLNWRLYWKYSKGLFAELGSHQVNVVDWFFGAQPEAVSAVGSISRFKDGREVPDHIYATFEYSGGRTATFSSIESNAFEDSYEAFFGTKGSLFLTNEREAYLFPEGKDAGPTGIELSPKSGPVLDAAESRAASAVGGLGSSRLGGGDANVRNSSYQLQVSGFCAAIRTGKPLACGPERAVTSARACITAQESADKKARLTL